MATKFIGCDIYYYEPYKTTITLKTTQFLRRMASNQPNCFQSLDLPGEEFNNSSTFPTLSLEKFDSPFFSECGIRWPLALIRNLEERGGILFTDFRKLVCFENTKMAQLVYHFPQKNYGSDN